MFIVEFMVNRHGKMVNPCGSDYTAIMKDLKTVRGVKNRLLSYSMPKDVVKVDIYSCANVYDRGTYELMDTIKIA